MARHNLALLLGTLEDKPIIARSEEGEPVYALATVIVVRADRNAGDRRHGLVFAHIPIISRDAAIISEMDTWNENDIVEIKGPISYSAGKKKSTCPYCGAVQFRPGVNIYVNPIFAKKRGELSDKDECNVFLKDNREVSNQIYCFGNLCTDPKKYTIARNQLVTVQYQIALTRKFTIRTDPPERKTDFPWVKSYSDNALEDKERLMVGSSVFIDGCLQSRNIQRHATCEECDKEYTWSDRTLEIVPFETEYIYRIKTDGEVDKDRQKFYDQKEKDIFTGADDTITEDDIKRGFDLEDLKD